jgi:hypothetical protein
MKRLIGLLALAAALATVLLVPPATAKEKDYQGPACTNIMDGWSAGYLYNATDQSGTVQAVFALEAPACAPESYLLEINAFTSPHGFLVSQSQEAVPGETTVTINYSFPAGEAPSDGVCVAVTTYYNKHVADVAPDSGCIPIDAESGGGSGFGG